MRLNVTVRHGQVNDGVHAYVETKFAKLGRRLHEDNPGMRAACFRRPTFTCMERVRLPGGRWTAR